ncbi:HD domain-containing protein [Chromobacterium subtsugae]|uniref:HD domain-containing protein n=1 Tax=Chromobacterium subtsugae TaxID=251747 RepID=A0ABS7FGB0_9NEIS|nr:MULTISPECIES: HD domain-containing protein [Chromobacterium]KUM01926.1 hydrolase [Chromobacterium subtsugae]KZE84897.1 hydrolase [Chromobacterium sp. F49]MBW7567891.1 HD domain-containing protein [Chromobacterium subtsugae]MBW8289118.1 HD domain-containing protein [Chromobacterium subtsugae]OBU85434.1 hydrolase [Chromobacterium subtsugae]
MTPQQQTDWQNRLITLLEQQPPDDDGAHDLSHLHRVWAVARQLLAHHPEADARVVMAGCYLHDLVNLPKNHPQRQLASHWSAERARQLLADDALSAEQLDNLAHAIEAHSYSAAIPPRTLEAKIVQDADRMDALGPVGLARMFYVSGRMGRALAHPLDPLAEQRGTDDQAWALDHIAVKLAKLPAMMQTEAGRGIAERKLQWLLAFRDEFCQDWMAR